MQPYAKWNLEREAYARSKLERKYRRVCGGFTLVADCDLMRAMLIGKTICELCVSEKVNCEGTIKEVKD